MVDDTSAWQFNVDAPDRASVADITYSGPRPNQETMSVPARAFCLRQCRLNSSGLMITELEPEEIDKNAFASLGNLGRSHSFYICPFAELKCPYE